MDGGGNLRRIEYAVRPLGNRLYGVKLVVDFVEHPTVRAYKLALDLSGDDQDG